MNPAVIGSAQPSRRLSAAVRMRDGRGRWSWAWVVHCRGRGSWSVYTTRRPARGGGPHKPRRLQRGLILDSHQPAVPDRPARRLRRDPGLQRGRQRPAARAGNPRGAGGPLRLRDDLRRRRQHGRRPPRRCSRREAQGMPEIRLMRHVDPLRPERRGGDRRARRARAVDRDARRRRTERSGRHSRTLLDAHDAAASPQLRLVMGNRTTRRDTWLRRLSSRVANGVRGWPAQGRHARHRLRHQGVRPRGVHGHAALQEHAPLHAGAVPARGLRGGLACRSTTASAPGARRSTDCTTGCGSASSTCSA